MTTLAQYERVRAALAKATSITEILTISQEVEHVILHAKQIQDRALLADAYEYQLRVERRLGEVIVAAKSCGYFREGRPKKNGSASEPFSGVTLAEAGVDKKLSSRAQQRSSISEEAFERVVQRTRERIASDRAKFIEGVADGGRSVLADRREPDDSLDYYPTPPWATRALIEIVLPHIGINIRKLNTAWEPACGEGHIAEVLREYFRDVTASDIHDYDYNDHVVDFLTCEHINKQDDPDWIITNPPFGAAALQFVTRSLPLARQGVAMFFRSQWAVEGIERYETIFRDTPPTLCAFFVERVNLCKGRWEPDGSTAMAYCWLVWAKGWPPEPTFWIPPGCRDKFTKPDDSARFTTHPVMKADHVVCDEPFDATTGEIKAADDVAAMIAPTPAQAPRSPEPNFGRGD